MLSPLLSTQQCNELVTFAVVYFPSN